MVRMENLVRNLGDSLHFSDVCDGRRLRAHPGRAFSHCGRNFRFGIWWPMRSPLSLGVCQKAVGGGIAGFLPAPSNPTGSDFPLVRLRSAPAFRLASSPRMRAPGLRQGLLRLTLEFGPLLGPLPPPRRPGSWGWGGALSETGDRLAQPWLWATRLTCRPCVCSGRE